MKPKTIALLVLALLCLIVLVQNYQVVRLKLFFWHFDIAMVVLGIMLLLIGFVAGYLMAKVRARPSKIKGQMTE